MAYLDIFLYIKKLALK